MSISTPTLAHRIIPCLDIRDGRTVKGINFENIRDAGDPVELALRYCDEGADELVFLDITATVEKRKTLIELVNRIASHINIPFTVGGGTRAVADAEILLQQGADKISVNTAAVQNPELVSQLATAFGSQCVVAAIDTRIIEGEWKVVTHGGRQDTHLKTTDWAKELSDRGAGEILLTSMENDGAKTGFALDITNAVSTSVPIPVIASGGAGKEEHFKDVFTTGKADAALAASIFHFGEIPIPQLKQYLRQQNITVRL
jgi:imidazole glycerol-phosphate synthase subunit HisF